MLVIDIGNTNLVFAFWNGTDWAAMWREETTPNRPMTDYARSFRIQLLENNLTFSDIQKVVIGSVVPPLTGKIQEMIQHTLEVTPLVMSPTIYEQLPLKVTNTAEIGADLVANSLAAFSRYSQSVIVVDFGTALTFTSITDKGVIEGVAIAPGLKTAMRALSGNTAQLPEVPLEVPKSALGKNTVHAMQAGVLLGYIGMVKHMIAETKKELGEGAKVIATGGLSSILTDLHSEFDEIDVLLTIDGLRLASDAI